MLALSIGCQTAAPIHLWKPAKLATMDAQPIVLMGIKGPEKTVNALRTELLERAIQNGRFGSTAHRGERLSFVLPQDLPQQETIRLVSGVEKEITQSPELGPQSSDLAVAAAARRSGIHHLLHGEVMFATGREESDQQLAVVWRLVGLTADATTAGIPVSVNQKSIEQEHPDLMPIADPRERLRRAMVRETLALLTSSVDRQMATLARPRGTLGSRAIREGNELARNGNWPAAEEKWIAITQRYPGKTTAWINAAIAAVARQNFVEAKSRAARAVRLAAFDPFNRTLAEETLVWVEMRQREYHLAFGLPDPTEGWRVSRAE